MQNVEHTGNSLNPPATNPQERRNVAINLELAKLGTAEQYIASLPNTRLQRLIDEGAVYLPQTRTPSHLATLHSLLDRILTRDVNPAHLAARLDAALAAEPAGSLSSH